MRVRREPTFVDDLSDAYAFLAERSPSAADRLIEAVARLADLLGDVPEMGRVRRDLGVGLRSFRVEGFPHVAFYRIERNELVLLRLLHGARRIRPRLFRR